MKHVAPTPWQSELEDGSFDLSQVDDVGVFARNQRRSATEYIESLGMEMTVQLAKLARDVRAMRSPRTKLRRIFVGLWSDIPAADHCFANALIEALSAAAPGEQKPDDLLKWSETFVTDLLRECLPAERQHVVADQLFANMIWMAFDGFAINRRLGDLRDVEQMADSLIVLILGTGRGAQGAPG